MKTCSKCKEEKPDTGFFKKSDAKDGLDFRCKDCWKEYRATRYIKEYRSEYRQTDAYRERHREYQREWRRKNETPGN